MSSLYIFQVRLNSQILVLGSESGTVVRVNLLSLVCHAEFS